MVSATSTCSVAVLVTLPEPTEGCVQINFLISSMCRGISPSSAITLSMMTAGLSYSISLCSISLYLEMERSYLLDRISSTRTRKDLPVRFFPSYALDGSAVFRRGRRIVALFYGRGDLTPAPHMSTKSIIMDMTEQRVQPLDRAERDLSFTLPGGTIPYSGSGICSGIEVRAKARADV